MNTKLLSIIILAYNSRERLREALNSLFVQDLEDIEIIVIDNGSLDPVQEFIKRQFKPVITVKNDKNMGASFGRNQGIALARGAYIMFMDCDAELRRDFFLKLRPVLEQLPENIAGVSPKIIDKSSQKIFSCGLRISPIYRAHDIGNNRNVDDFSQSFKIDGLNTCCAIFRKDYLKEIKDGNYFDEDFFFLFEDVDLALRMKNKGYSFLFVPSLACHHKGDSSNTPAQLRRFLCFRNRWYMILKIKNKSRLFSFLLRSFFYDFFRTLHFSLTNPFFCRALRDVYRKFQSQ